MTKIEEMIKQINKLKAELKKNGSKLVGEYVKDLLSDYKDVVAIRWSQFTPYFNDGEPCVFGVNEAYVKFSDTPDDGGENEDGFESEWELDGTKRKATKEISTAVSKIPKEIMQAAFGDHVEITVTKKKGGGVAVSVNEYEHD